MMSVQTDGRFSLQELLEFFRPHALKLRGADCAGEASNLLPMRANVVKRLSERACVGVRGSAPGLPERSVFQVKQSAHTVRDTLDAMHRGEDVIAGGVLQSRQYRTNPPFLVKKHGVNSRAGRFHYEVWACVEAAPNDPSILLELCAAARALEDSIGAMPKQVHIAVVTGQVLDFDTESLNNIYEELQTLYLQSRKNLESNNRPSVLDFAAFRLRKHPCGGY